jgi:hypothetical protein
MKTIKAFLLRPLLTIIFTFMLSSCYTQFAIVDDEDSAAVDSSPTIIYQPEIIPVYLPGPVYDPPPPVYDPSPSTGSSSTVTQSPPQSRTRESGYQQTSQSDNAQTTSSGSNTRTSGAARSGR